MLTYTTPKNVDIWIGFVDSYAAVHSRKTYARVHEQLDSILNHDRMFNTSTTDRFIFCPARKKVYFTCGSSMSEEAKLLVIEHICRRHGLSREELITEDVMVVVNNGMTYFPKRKRKVDGD
jgi:hypothetical protein